MNHASQAYDDGLKFALELITAEMIGALKGIVETPGTDPTPLILPRIVAGLVAERLRYAKAESEAPAPVAAGHKSGVIAIVGDCDSPTAISA